MQPLEHANFLELWETGSRLHPLDRGLLAIRASLASDEKISAIADWPLGRCNQALAEVRSLYFGPRIEGWTTCAGCGEKLEFEFDCGALASFDAPVSMPRVAINGAIFRVPTTQDLARVVDAVDPEEAAVQLINFCLIEDSRANGEAVRDWSADKIDAVAEAMAGADPLAEIALDLECPLCSHASEEMLDLGEFVWSEIEARARRLLADVHALASAYGWSEAAILAMSDLRRRGYIAMVEQ
jgi:hypothetical protein